MIGLLSDPVWNTSLGLGLALLFAAAVVHKLRDRAGFTAVLQSYGLLPAGLIPSVGVLMPVLELVCASGLLLPSSRASAALLAVALLAVYAAVMALSLRQGRRIADCGCQFGEQQQVVSAPLVWRNLLLAVLASSLLLEPLRRELGLFDGLVIGFVLLGSCVFYLLANTLIANFQSARELSL